MESSKFGKNGLKETLTKLGIVLIEKMLTTNTRFYKYQLWCLSTSLRKLIFNMGNTIPLLPEWFV